MKKVFFLFFLGCCQLGYSQTTLIDFEDISPRTIITTEYSQKGVRFEPSDFVDSDPKARSGQNVLRNNNPTREFDTGLMKMVFISPVSNLSFYAGTPYSNIKGTLKAFDESGNIVAQDGPKTITPSEYTTKFQVSSSNPIIVSATLHYTDQFSNSAFESIDDLEFSSQGDIILPTEPPVIESFQVLGNGQGNQLVQPEVLITGTIIGQDVLSPATVSIAKSYPEGSLAPPESNNQVRLNNSGETNTFSFPITLSMGTQTVKLTVQNSAGLQASQSQTVTVLPNLISDRLQEEGGLGVAGAFLFSGSDSDCRYVVYENMAIAQVGTHTYVVKGPMLEAWTSKIDMSSYPKLGCPVAEEVQLEGNIVYQRFTNGMIYLDGQDFYEVPNIFAEVLLNHRREEKEWVPIMDPTRSLPMQTELFQRFRRIDKDESEITIEIIGGTFPKLLVERGRGGVIDDILTTAPVWDIFDCEGPLGPCNFDIDSPPLSDPGSFCNYRSYEEILGSNPFSENGVIRDPSGYPPAWVPVTGQYTQTHLQGIVKTFKKADADLWFTHEHMEFPQWEGIDWNLDVIPNPGFKNILTMDRNYVHVEWNSVWSQHFFAFGFNVVPGDAFFTSGRWVIDCGHPTFKSEIHPPSVIASTRTHEFNDKTSTISYIWVNGFYSGEEVNFNIYPPPRPTPNSTLNVTKEGGEPLDINVVDNLRPWGVSFKINAPRKENEVTQYGLFKWDYGRSYEGKYTLYWSE